MDVHARAPVGIAALIPADQPTTNTRPPRRDRGLGHERRATQVRSRRHDEQTRLLASLGSTVCRVGEFDHIAAAMEASPLMAELKAMGLSGDFSKLERNAAKRHHYVPQFVLRGFADPADGGRRIFQMPTGSRKAPIRVGVRDAALRQWLYRVVTPEGGTSNRHEGYLALIEEHAAPAIARFIAEPSSLAPGDRATIAFFVAVQTMRTPVAAEQITALANAALQNAVSEVYSDREAFAQRHREHFGPGASDEEIEEFRLDVIDQVRTGKVRVSGRGGADFATGLEHAASLIPQIFAFDWALLRSAGGFITSDRGYAIHDPAPPFPWVAPSLLSSPASETLVPLHDTSVILMRPGTAMCHLDVRDASSSDVERLNLRTLGWADEYVFAKRQSTLDSVRASARRRPAAVVRPRPFCEVVLIELDPDDPSLAVENVRRGWPSYLPAHDGKPHDYLVIPTDAPQPQLRRRADDLAERRALKRLGLADGTRPGRLSHRPINPLDIAG